MPRFDSEPLFCGLLDAAGGGAFTVAREDVIEARQRYEPDSAVLVTERRSPTGVLAVTDAAPTSSLPAPIGGVRNWDYRYTWVRDASFSVYALRRIGFAEEAGAFLGWVLDTFEHAAAPKPQAFSHIGVIAAGVTLARAAHGT
jgi:glycosyl hydrolase family 15